MQKTTKIKLQKRINFLRNLSYAFSVAVRKKVAPLYVLLSLTSKCNLKCPYCYAVPNEEFFSKTDDIPSRMTDLPPDKIYEIAQGLYKMGTRFINIVGGEPTLRKDFHEIIARLFSMGFSLDMITNGVLLDRCLPALSYFNRIIISLEGNKESHDRDRGEGTFEKIICNLDLIKSRGVDSSIKFNMTLTKHNVCDVSDLLQTADKYDAQIFLMEPCNKAGSDERNRHYASKQEIVDLFNEILENRKTSSVYKRILLYNEEVLNKFQWVEPYQIFYNNEDIPKQLWEKGKPPQCDCGKYSMFADSDGTFYPCSNLFGKLGANAFKHGTEEAYKIMNAKRTCKYCLLAMNTSYLAAFRLNFKTMYRVVKQFNKNTFWQL